MRLNIDIIHRQTKEVLHDLGEFEAVDGTYSDKDGIPVKIEMSPDEKKPFAIGVESARFGNEARRVVDVSKKKGVGEMPITFPYSVRIRKVE